jgi:WD40 repeat protein
VLQFARGADTPVVTASSDGTARVWDAAFQPQLRLLARLGPSVTEVSVLARNRIRAVTADGRAHIIDARTGKQLRSGPASKGATRAVSVEGATATIRGKAVVLRSGGRIFVLKGHRDRVLSVRFSPDGSLLASASKDHDVRMWDVATGDDLFRLQHAYQVNDAEFSPDGRWIVTASGRAGLYDTRDSTLALRLQGHDRPVASATFDPTGRWIVTGGDDGTVRRYRCDVCGGMNDLMRLAQSRLAITGRQLTARERSEYLG